MKWLSIYIYEKMYSVLIICIILSYLNKFFTLLHEKRRVFQLEMIIYIYIVYVGCRLIAIHS